MKRPQADKSIGDIKEELDNSKTKTSRQMENNFSQARVIPVQHEQASQHWQQPNVQRSTAHQPTFFNHQWPSHNPQQMPQPQYFSTPHPNMANQYYPQQFYQQQQPQQRYPPHPSAHPEPSNNQRRQQPHSAGRTIPIQVVHDSTAGKNNFHNQPEQHQSSTLPFHANENRTDPSVGQTSISKSPQINSNPASTSNSDAAPNKLFAATTEHDEVDDHRVVDALKQITAVLADMEEQEKEVDSFSGSRTDKQFLKLENYLTNKLLRLDEINASGAPGAEKVRTERKAAIKRVQHTLDVLELKVLSD